MRIRPPWRLYRLEPFETLEAPVLRDMARPLLGICRGRTIPGPGRRQSYGYGYGYQYYGNYLIKK